MKSNELIEIYGDFLYDSYPHLFYPDEKLYVKRRFTLDELDFKNTKEPVRLSRKESKEILKSTRLKFKRGDFLVHKKSAHGSGIVPGFGAIAGNLFGKEWDHNDLDFLMSQDISGIIWQKNGQVLVYSKDRSVTSYSVGGANNA